MRQFQGGFWLGFSVQVYQRLLIILPAEFRQHYAQEMAQVFRDCCSHAYRSGGSIGVLGEFVVSTFDLLANAIKERISALVNDDRRMLVLLTISIVAITAGAYAAFADLKRDEWPGPIFMVVIFTFALGFLRPSSAWLTGVLVGSMVPMMHFIAGANGWEMAPPIDDPPSVWRFMALIPSFTGSTLGVVFRRVVNRLSGSTI